ncbi:MAG TPA: sugar phosphate isomerase/epimerase [Novosphingobium sp.]|nr:sugar phosphate isomerase/epimerase [Novosphingobium sp.]
MSDKSSNLRWAYMDHWRVDTPQGVVSQYTSLRHFDRFLKQIAAVGFEAIETFSFHTELFKQLNGSLKDIRSFMQDRGIDRVLSLFAGVIYDDSQIQPHLPETHDRMVGYARHIVDGTADLGVENLIVMPAAMYSDVAPVTDDKIKAIADQWSKVGRMTMEDYGIKTCCHHEFFCGIRGTEEVLKFYEYADPDYVFWYCDTAQHTICGSDVVELYDRLHARCGGFHLKDTHNVDLIGDYKRSPEAETTSQTTDRWFWEMGTEEGLVDFPAFFEAMKRHGYKGWVSVEHDKADIGGSNYPESTAVAAWYIQNVLEPIYS